MRRWIQVEARFATLPIDLSPYVEAFGRFGCENTLETADGAIQGCFEEIEGAEHRAQELARELGELGATTTSVTKAEDQDWSELWKAHFKPRRIGRRWVVVPSWEHYSPRARDVVLELDPGQAFGTGDHPTTRLCLSLLEASSPRGLDVLDLGCGSGILAIGVSKLGARSVAAVDIEPAAAQIARQNAARNGAEIEVFEASGFDGWAGARTWDLVLSNIVSATLIRLASDIARRVPPGGRWIVSGVLKANLPDVRRAAEQAGFVQTSQLDEDDWIGAVFERRRPAS